MLTPLTFVRCLWYCFDVPIKQALIKSPRLDIVAHITRMEFFDVYKIATGTFIQESSLFSCVAGYIVPLHENER